MLTHKSRDKPRQHCREHVQVAISKLDAHQLIRPHRGRQVACRRPSCQPTTPLPGTRVETPTRPADRRYTDHTATRGTRRTPLLTANYLDRMSRVQAASSRQVGKTCTRKCRCLIARVLRHLVGRPACAVHPKSSAAADDSAQSSPLGLLVAHLLDPSRQTTGRGYPCFSRSSRRSKL